MSGSFGPMKLDFSSFYKFVASVGLVLVAASVLLPWFVLRASVPEAPVGTSAARVVDVALDERADQYLFVIRMYPWASLVLFLVGCGMTGYGLVAWRDRQKRQDADDDELYLQRKELGRTTRASDNDRAEKLDREALEGGGPADDVATQPKSAATPGESQITQPKSAMQAMRGTGLAEISSVRRKIGSRIYFAKRSRTHIRWRRVSELVDRTHRLSILSHGRKTLRNGRVLQWKLSW